MSQTATATVHCTFSSPPREVTDREDDDRTEETPDLFSLPKKKQRYQYRDLSTAFALNSLAIDDPRTTQGQTTQRLPTKLNAILSNPDIQHIVSWLPHGRSWKVHDSQRFMEEVMPHYFEYTNYYSFIRLVNAWGFRRMSRGPSKDSYWHEMFLRGLPHLHSRMRRLTLKDKKEVLAPDEEPDLFDQSRLHPLPLSSVIPFPPRPPKRLWLEEQERLQKQNKQPEEMQKIPSPPTVVRESHFVPYQSSPEPTSDGASLICQQDGQRRNPVMHAPFGVEPGSGHPNVEHGPGPRGCKSLIRHDEDQRRLLIPFAPSLVEQYTVNPNAEYRPGHLGCEEDHNHDTFSSPHIFSVSQEAEALRFQQAGLAATRRAMEAQLEDLRKQEGRLAMAAAVASANSNGQHLQRSMNQQQVTMPGNQVVGRRWLVPLRPPLLSPMRTRYPVPHSGAARIMCAPQHQVYWNAAANQQNPNYCASPPTMAAMSPAPIPRPVIAPSPPQLMARRNSVILHHPLNLE